MPMLSRFAATLLTIVFGSLSAALPIHSAHGDELIEVDAQLVLAVDVSRSMSANELEIQRRGYAEALASEEVVRAIQSGLLGRVAITYVEWAGYASKRVIVDWTLVESGEDARAFASKLTAEFNSALRRTSISGAIDFGVQSIEENSFQSNRRIIDISGDGPNNQGKAVEASRNEALEKGIIINGLPLMTREGMGSQFSIDNLDEYYSDCVTGGPGSFVLPVHEWDQFSAAVRQKLVLELAGPVITIPVPDYLPVIRATGGGTDCYIGEKIWEIFRQQWYFDP